jgi:hypothetical protein
MPSVMIDKLFGKPPADMDDKMWLRHWAFGFAAVGAVATISFLVFKMWAFASQTSPHIIH